MLPSLEHCFISRPFIQKNGLIKIYFKDRAPISKCVCGIKSILKCNVEQDKLYTLMDFFFIACVSTSCTLAGELDRGWTPAYVFIT